MADGIRYGLLVRTCLEVLCDGGERMPGRKVLDEVEKRLDLTEAERLPDRSGTAAWRNVVSFSADVAATIGWLVKRDNLWSITDAGRAGLDTQVEPEAFYSEVGGRYLRVRTAETVAPEGAARRAWLIRRSNVDGIDLVPSWLGEGWISLAASQLPELDPAVGRQRLREIVDETYRHKSYSVREKLLAQFDAFLRGMRPDDYLLAVHRGEVHLGLVNGPAYFAETSDRRSNLRRQARWLNLGQPHDLTELPGALPALTQSQDDLIDLTDALDTIERLYADVVPEQPVVDPVPEARLADVTAELADDLLTDLNWLRDVAQLLSERRQVILYGPPGTGKTYLAQRLAARLTEPHAVKLIQFHPSYTYEDFFEGFRPESGVDGTLRFKLTPVRCASSPTRPGSTPATAYILIIDEINRAQPGEGLRRAVLPA